MPHHFDDLFVRAHIPPSPQNKTFLFHCSPVVEIGISLRAVSAHLCVSTMYRIKKLLLMGKGEVDAIEAYTESLIHCESRRVSHCSGLCVAFGYAV
jgi:hypothetical protein